METIPVMKPWLGDEEAEAAAAAVRSGWVAQGPRVGHFETEFAESVGASHAVAVSSCTTALHLGLVVAGIGPGDEVVVPSLSFVATTNVVRYVGATPVFADVDVRTANLTQDTIAPVITDRTRAIILVHQGGMPADLAGVRSLVAGRDILILEDAACAAGSRADNHPVGSGSDLAAWSFHPRKLLTTGEGGMVTLERADWAARLRRLREHGMDVSAADRHAQGNKVILEKYLEVGFNYRMTDVQAAIGIVQLRKLPQMVDRRREIVQQYREALDGLAGLTTVVEADNLRANYQSFWVKLDERWPLSRNETLERLAAQGIQARRGIMAAHLEPAYAEFGDADLPATVDLTNNSLILPVFHQMTADQIERVIRTVRSLGATG